MTLRELLNEIKLNRLLVTFTDDPVERMKIAGRTLDLVEKELEKIINESNN